MNICHWNYQALFGLGIWAGLLAMAPIAGAHGVNVSHDAGAAVRVQASFDSGEPMAAAQVSVFAPGDVETPWMTGTTDPAGNFAFVPDPAQVGRWEVQVRLAGHGEIVYVPVDDVSAATASVAHPVPTDEASDPELLASSARRSPSLAVAAPPRSPAGLSVSQKLLMGAVFAWGCVGTALYAKRSNEIHSNKATQQGDIA